MLEGKGMDYEGMGFALGAARAFDNLEDEANRRIRTGNVTINQQTSRIRELEQQLAEAQAALALEQAGRAGVLAQAKSLRAEVVRLEPANKLLRETGRKFAGGQPHRALDLIFEEAFDAKATALGFEELKATRPRAK